MGNLEGAGDLLQEALFRLQLIQFLCQRSRERRCFGTGRGGGLLDWGLHFWAVLLLGGSRVSLSSLDLLKEALPFPLQSPAEVLQLLILDGEKFKLLFLNRFLYRTEKCGLLWIWS